jgi:hypothetical protein
MNLVNDIVYCWFKNECVQRTTHIAQISAVTFKILYAMKQSIYLSSLEIIVLLIIEKMQYIQNSY